MFHLNSIYKPATAQPFLNTYTYSEYPPCDELKPFIACFWGSQGPVSTVDEVDEAMVVIPDTCMDIIFDINHINGAVESRFCGINDMPFTAGALARPALHSRFGIRFYFWAVHLFAGHSMRESTNGSFELELHFSEWRDYFENRLLVADTLIERKQMAEQYILSKLDTGNSNHHLLNATYRILQSKGTQSIKDICSYTSTSQRQLERYFLDKVGITIKKVSNLVRYQNLWNDILYSNCVNVQDAVEKYGYTDQSHLINEFRKYHGNTPAQAKNSVCRFFAIQQK